MKLSLVSAALFLLACPPSPAPPQPDAADAGRLEAAPASSAQAICNHLAAIGCLEGADIHCADVLEHVTDSGLTRLDLPCLTTAATKEAARACGGLDCP